MGLPLFVNFLVNHFDHNKVCITLSFETNLIIKMIYRKIFKSGSLIYFIVKKLT